MHLQQLLARYGLIAVLALLGHVKRVELWLLGAAIVGVVIVFLIDKTAKHELHIDDTEKKE